MASTGVEGGRLFLGVDGGGSSCRARLRGPGGACLVEVRGGAANVYLDPAGALETVRACVAEALGRAGLGSEGAARVSLGLGLSGVSSPGVAAETEAALPGFAAVRVSNDAVTACLGAHGGADGGLVIAGTGSAGLAMVDGRETFVGGRGFVLGDDGSGARIGLDAWRRALRAHDGLEAHTPYTRGLMARFGHDPAAAVRWGLAARSADFGAEAPACYAAAGAGDGAALAVVRAAAAALCELVEAVRRLGAVRVAMVGGGAAAARPYLPPAVAERLAPPLADPCDGAILLAGGRLP